MGREEDEREMSASVRARIDASNKSTVSVWRKAKQPDLPEVGWRTVKAGPNFFGVMRLVDDKKFWISARAPRD